MWIREIYSSGDLTHDEYLQFEDEPKFQDEEFLADYLMDLDECLRRLQEEKEWLEKYGAQVVGKMSWSEVFED